MPACTSALFYVDWFLPAAVGSGFCHPETSQCSQGEERAAGCTLTEPALKAHKNTPLTTQALQKVCEFVCVSDVSLCVAYCVWD